MTKKQAIIFLDVDGVLNSNAYFENNKDKSKNDISDFHLQMLAKIYHACDAKIVLSSSWRELDDPSDIHVYWMWEYLVDSLAKYDMEIIDKTPVIGMNRPLEIKTWLDNRPDKEHIRFVSLDDDFSTEHYEEYGIEHCLVKTKFWCIEECDGGLQEKHVEAAIKILNGETND